MDEKVNSVILVEVYVAVINEVYDFQLEENAEVEQVMEEIIGMVGKKLKSIIEKSNRDFLLCCVERGEILPREKTLADCKVKDGSHLLLV